jgi:hypothetical protein
MFRQLAFSSVAAIALPSCGYPAFAAAMRTNGYAPDVQLEGTCVMVDRTQAKKVVQAQYAQGYRLVYVSEYTSTNRAGFPALFCFERPRSQASADSTDATPSVSAATWKCSARDTCIRPCDSGYSAACAGKTAMCCPATSPYGCAADQQCHASQSDCDDATPVSPTTCH